LKKLSKAGFENMQDMLQLAHTEIVETPTKTALMFDDE
jgi:hypothetical protein